MSLLKNLFHFYDVKYVMAFNSGFDMTKTKCRELLDDFEFIDIWLMALQTLTHYKKFKTFCDKFEVIVTIGPRKLPIKESGFFSNNDA